jgi:hypothetical protein
LQIYKVGGESQKGAMPVMGRKKWEIAAKACMGKTPHAAYEVFQTN